MLNLNRFAPVLATTLMLFSVSQPAEADSTFEVLRSYYELDANLPLALEKQSDVLSDGKRVVDLTFKGFDNEMISGRMEYLTVEGGGGKRPVVILLHGITQSLDQWWRTDDGPYSFPAAHREALVKNGFAVLAIDLRNHGARLQSHDFANPYAYLEQSYFEAARKMISQSVLDVRRTIDVAQTFEEIDAERIAIAGFSLGAWTGFLAASVDERVDASVIIGMPFLLPAKGQSTHFISQFEYVVGLQGKPMLLIAGSKDHFYTKDVVDMLEQKLSPSGAVKWLESGHDFPRSTAALTLEFLNGAY
ncbi:alpha/beta fold hydrolase [Rhodobacteraceae bacterium D3-12]|nr:alpha/beta fold hydrolase [Rhodobacteraceae bacterium D3-12]